VLTYLDIPGLSSGPGFYLFGGTSAGSPQWAAITAIADQKAEGRLGFLNKALYQIGESQRRYSSIFHDITSGNNSVVESDSNNHPVGIQGFNAGPEWDPTTGLGSPIANQLVDSLIKSVSQNDGQDTINGTSAHSEGNFSKHGKVKPH